MLHQTFEPRDLFLVFVLVVLEGLLSIDNALVLGLIARKLPENRQKKALTYGLIGSFFFRMFAIVAAAWLLKWRIIKVFGGGYLIYVALKHLLAKHDPAKKTGATANQNRDFWSVVVSIELTDVAFAADSILAGIALVGPLPAHSQSAIHPKLWVIMIGGLAGVMLMRVAAVAFIKLLKRFPGFESTAYMLVALVGVKLLADYWFNANEEVLNFQSPAAAAFWVFWGLMALCVGFGFLPHRRHVPIHPSAT